MSTPVFVKGNLEFTIDNTLLEYKNQNVSIFGVTGLDWEPLRAETHFGKNVIVNLRLSTPTQVNLVTDAIIMREQTSRGDYMALKFTLNSAHRDRLLQTIREHGFFPAENMRKYPRIPATDRVQTFPLRILGSLVSKKYDIEEAPVIFKVEDISLGGVLISTENPYALAIGPGRYLDLYIEPRGDFSLPIRIQGLVCRYMEEISNSNGNMVRYLGVRFSKVSEENRVAFLELLKDILERIKRSM